MVSNKTPNFKVRGISSQILDASLIARACEQRLEGVILLTRRALSLLGERATVFSHTFTVLYSCLKAKIPKSVSEPVCPIARNSDDMLSDSIARAALLRFISGTDGTMLKIGGAA